MKTAVLAGDGIGPEVTAQSVKLLRALPAGAAEPVERHQVDAECDLRPDAQAEPQREAPWCWPTFA